MGYAYTSVPTFQDKKLLLEAHAGDDYKLLEGKALQEDLVRQYSDEHGEDTYLEVPEYHLLKVKFDSFTYDKERELLNSIASVNVWLRTFDNMFEIDSLTILTKSNPPSVNLWSA